MSTSSAGVDRLWGYDGALSVVLALKFRGSDWVGNPNEGYST